MKATAKKSHGKERVTLEMSKLEAKKVLTLLRQGDELVDVDFSDQNQLRKAMANALRPLFK